MSSACSTRNAALRMRLRDRELVHLLVVALLQVDDLALARAADEDHREAVGRRVGERRQAVQEARRGHGEADARLLRHEAGDRGGIAGVLLVAERDHAHAGGLQLAREVGDRDAGQAEDRVDAVQLERLDDELEAVGFLRGRSVAPPRRPSAAVCGDVAVGADLRASSSMAFSDGEQRGPAGAAQAIGAWGALRRVSGLSVGAPAGWRKRRERASAACRASADDRSSASPVRYADIPRARQRRFEACGAVSAVLSSVPGGSGRVAACLDRPPDRGSVLRELAIRRAPSSSRNAGTPPPPAEAASRAGGRRTSGRIAGKPSTSSTARRPSLALERDRVRRQEAQPQAGDDRLLDRLVARDLHGDPAAMRTLAERLAHRVRGVRARARGRRTTPRARAPAGSAVAPASGCAGDATITYAWGANATASDVVALAAAAPSPRDRRGSRRDRAAAPRDCGR